jgi:hypothetical protein
MWSGVEGGIVRLGWMEKEGEKGERTEGGGACVRGAEMRGEMRGEKGA